MAVQGGTLTVRDTLQSLRVVGGTVASIGEDHVFSQILYALQIHNTITTEMLSTFCNTTTQRLLRVGGVTYTSMQKLNEFGRARPQSQTQGALLGLPLTKYGASLQWTRDYFKNADISEFTAQVQGLITADLRNIQTEVKKALFNPTNFDHYDDLIDNSLLKVKRLQNNDSTMPVPISPDGTQFATTHNHYLAYTSLTTTALDAGKLTVVEHMGETDGATIMCYINPAQEVTMTGLTGFTPIVATQQLVPSVSTTRGIGELNVINVLNRLIGFYNGMQVWVKAWVYANYVLIFATGDGVDKPLAFRMRGTGKEQTDGSVRSIISGNGSEIGNGDLQLVYDYDNFPLRAKEYQREFGIGVVNRVAAAIVYIAGSSYTDPT